MKTLRFLSLAAAAGTLLMGCETAATYHPRTDANGTGYSDEQLTGNRYRVSFTGNTATRRETVENFLLLHAAEVTLKAGYRFFLCDTRDTTAKTTYHSDFLGWSGWRGYGWYWHNWPFEPIGVDSRAVTRYEAYAEIVLLTEGQAKTEPRAINASEVMDHLGALTRPKS